LRNKNGSELTESNLSVIIEYICEFSEVIDFDILLKKTGDADVVYS